ncbi:MAG: UxaA family hydrolase [Desulfobacteraceae bacterium]|nr:UxaA family hydrolase [Desulfobacteraceae bacterium]
MKFMGYRRNDGRVGVRNYVLVVSTVFCGSSVAQKIAALTDTALVTHQGGCGQLGPDKEHTLEILTGVVTHPNVGGVLVVGLGCEQVDAKELMAAADGKPARYLSIHDVGGNQNAEKSGVQLVNELKLEVEKAKRVPVGIDELIIATQCGSSDTGSGLASNPVVGELADLMVGAGGTVILGETGSLYGAAGLMARRAVTPELGQRIIEITNVRERHYKRMGKSIKEANPTPGNIEGGLTTLVEKSLGGVRKGGTTPIQGLLKPGEKIMGKGLWVMDTSLGLGACASADMLAGGAQIMAYTTGKGNPVGSPIAPVIKITATRETVTTLDDIIDFDASPVLLGNETLKDCGRRLLEEVRRVADGDITKSEKFGSNIFAIGSIAVG